MLRHCMRVGVSMAETISSSMLYPLLRVQHLIVEPIVSWMGRSVSIRELEATIEHMRKEREILCAENIALKALQLYAHETSELRAFNQKYALHNGCMVQILARHFSTSTQFFLVNAGSSQGIKKDMVAVYGNSVVGRVAEVYPWYCKVCLITDADCKIASTCFKKAVSGIHEGLNDVTRTTMRYVSHLESVDLADTVLSSGEGLVFPKGFALGTIIAIDKGDLFYTITIQPTLDFQTLRYCTLIAKENI